MKTFKAVIERGTGDLLISRKDLISYYNEQLVKCQEDLSTHKFEFDYYNGRMVELKLMIYVLENLTL